MIWLLAPLTLGILWALYAISPTRRWICLLDNAAADIQAIQDELKSLRERWRSESSSSANAYKEEIYLERLRILPLDELKKHATGLRLQPLREIGIRNLADMRDWNQGRLANLRGVGPKSAALIPGIVQNLTSAARTRPIPDPETPFRRETERLLVQAIYREIACEETLGVFSTEFARLAETVQQRRDEVKRKAQFVRWIWTLGRGPTIAGAVKIARETTASLESGGSDNVIRESARILLDRCRTLLSERVTGVTLSRHYAERWDAYDLVLGRVMGSTGRVRLSAIPQLLVERMEQHTPVLEDSEVPKPDNGQVHVEFGRLVAGPPPVPQDASSTASPVYERPPLDPIRQAKREELQAWINSVAPPRFVVGVHESEAGLESFRIGSESVDAVGFSLPKPSSTVSTKGERWVPKDKPAIVQEITLPRGMVFLGRKTSNYHLGVIYPHLPVAVSDAVVTDEIRYWQGYEALSPEARFAYLSWLANGATYTSNEPFAMLYFCGLERRLVLFAGPADEEMKPETATILEEVARLAEEFRAAHIPLNDYSNRLRDFCTLRHRSPNAPFELPTDWQRSYELPWGFAYDLGRFARANQPLPAGWALRWVQLDPHYYLRTPATRCPVEFSELFAKLYARRYNAGLLLPSEGRPLTLEYTTAAYHLRTDCPPLSFEGIPDVRSLDTVSAELRGLAEDATNALNVYSRFCGRMPEKSRSLQAYLQLPSDVWPEPLREKLAELRTKAAARQPLLWSLFLQELDCDESLTASQLQDVLRGLERAGLGMEPDILSGGRRPKSDECCILFLLSGSEEAERTETEFKNAALSVALMACITAADGHASDTEQHTVDRLIGTWTSLHEDHRNRLSALYRLQVQQRAKLSALKAKLLSLSEGERTVLLASLSHIVTADNVVSAEEVHFMEQIYRLFGLDPMQLYASLHQRNTQIPDVAPTFQTISTATDSHEFRLDVDRIERLKAESAQVSKLLAEVFQEEPTIPSIDSDVQSRTLVKPIAIASSPIPGLGIKEAAFLTRLIEKPEWTRDELLKLAEDQQIMLDGAMEAINDAAFDAVGEPLLDGHDPIYVQTSLLENV